MQYINEQEKLRKYILGDLAGNDELLEVEERLMLDTPYFEELTIVEEELIQDYVVGLLTASDRTKFEKRFLISEENVRRVKFASEMDRVLDNSIEEPTNLENTQRNISFFSNFLSPVAVGLSALVIFAISAVFVWQVFLTGNSESLAALNKAFDKERPVESRITGLNYAPISVTRGGEGQNIDLVDLELSRTLALKAVRDSPTADNRHMLGRVFLTERRLDEAIEQFTIATNLSSKSAKIHNDLGIAWFEKGKADGGNLKYLGNSISEFEKAIELNKTLIEAYFNKALCLELMKTPLRAKNAWKEYLKRDASSEWADEAKQKLKSLEVNGNQSKTSEELLREFLNVYRKKDDVKAWRMLSRNREFISGKLIPEQLAFSFSSTKKQEYLDALIYAGNIEKKETGDSFWNDTAAFYSTASEEKLAKMEKAHGFLRSAIKFYLNGEYRQSLNKTDQAIDIFSDVGNKWEENKAKYWVGFLHYVIVKYDVSKKLLKSVRDYCKANDYRWLLAHTQFWIGVNYGSENIKSKTFDYYKKAAVNAESVSDYYNVQKILTESAEEYRLVGRPLRSLELLKRSLSFAHNAAVSDRQKIRTYDNLVRTFYSLKNYEAAIVYEKETVKLLDRESDISFRQTSNRQLGQILRAQKEYDEALKVLKESIENASAIQDNDTKKTYAARSHISVAGVYLDLGDFDKALLNYSKAINLLDTSEHKGESYLAHKGKLFCYLALDKQEEFGAEMKKVLRLLDEHRADILDEQSRNAFFDNEHSVYDLAVDFEYGRGNFQKAYDHSEQARSRSLLDLLENGAKIENSTEIPTITINNRIEPLGIKELKNQLPKQVQLVEYTILKDKLLIWLISNEKFEVVSVDISSESLQEMVVDYLNLVSTPNQDQFEIEKKLSKKLYDVLITPIIDKIDSKKTTTFIPDKYLFQIPFSSLISPKTNKFLIEEKEISFSPSANVFLVLSKKISKYKGKTSETILSIGNPSLDIKQYPKLRTLLSAEEEATEIAKHYSQPSKVLLRNEATKSTIKENLKTANVIHFAGHYVVNEKSPMLSSFILSPSAENKDFESDDLANYELMSEELSQTKLVVLSACRSGVEGYYKGEGMMGASRSFLAAGIPLVVASRWAVDSKATSELMIRFHKHRKQENLSTAKALRRAQLDLINGENTQFKAPYYWSSFMMLGGYAEF